MCAIRNYLVNFILHHHPEHDDAGRLHVRAAVPYSTYALRRLRGTIVNSGASGSVPSVEEIQAYSERLPTIEGGQ